MVKVSLLGRLAALVLAGAAFFAPSLALAQAPPPVPALPDSERRVSYSITAQTGPFSVPFALYGDSTDYQNWLQVSICTSAILNPCTVLTGVSDWTLSSATGSLASIPRPVTDATITLTTARTGTLQIVGARRPRRTSQFAENRGVAARDLNQVITDLTAQGREGWDLSQRVLRGQPGESISALQPASTRAGGILCWDATGLIPNTCAAGSSGTANVVGPNTSVVGHIAVFNNTSGTLLADGGLVGAGDVTGPGSTTTDHAATFSGATGKVLKDSGLTLTPSTGTFTLTNGKTLAVTNTLTFGGTDSSTVAFGAGGTVTYTSNNLSVFAATTSAQLAGVISDETGSGALVFGTSPVIVGGTVNALTSFSLANSGFNHAIASGGTITANRTLTINNNDANRTLSLSGDFTVASNSGTLAFGGSGKTLTVNNSLTLAGTDGKTLTVNNSGTISGGDAFTLSIAASKTLTVSNSLALTGTDGTSFAFPSTSDTVVTLGATQTLTSKTLTAPTINGGTHTAITSLGIRSTGTGAFDLTLNNTENLTAGRTLTLTLNNAARTISMTGNITTAADFTTAGANALTLTTTTPTNVTLPASGTLATRDTANTFSATNTFSALQQFTDVKFSSGKLYPTADSTTALQFTKADASTVLMDFDTTNRRVGINKTPTADLDVNGTIKFTTLDGASLQSSPSTITDMTINNTPNGSTDYIPYYNASAGAWRRGTVNAIATAATAGVSSLNGLTGGLSVVAGTGIGVSAGGSSVTVSTNFAAQSDQESASSTSLTVSPGRQHFHPSAAKAWCSWNGATAGTNACGLSYNVTSVQRVSAGVYNVNFAITFSGTEYACVYGTGRSGGGTGFATEDSSLHGTTSLRVNTFNSAFAATDMDRVWIACYGDL